ncbi:MAG: O-antigen polysaccharide polymerase Wzy family protein [[Actinobacillus] rossii]|nr:O-antigen polysaccharide polymerase Wzy family protein [[Actinobacillus] rossii]MDY5792909.1 O-antigen polysaccharide polymerase Wzy family protein [[Actinobacillus] rossii]
MSKEKILYILFDICLFLIYVLVFYFESDVYLILFFTVFLFIKNLFFSFDSFKDKFLLFVFYSFIFLFLLSRPLLAVFYDVNWIHIDYNSTKIALFLIGLSLIGISFGGVMATVLHLNIKRNFKSSSYKDNLFSTIKYMMFFFGGCKYVVEIIKYNNLKNLDYIEMYTDFGYTAPTFLLALSGFFIYFFMGYLSTFPDKKGTYISFLFYIGSLIPSFLLGSRADVAIVLVFFVLYLVIRQRYESEQSWFKRKHKFFVFISIPALMFIFFIVQQVRGDDGHYENMNYLMKFIYLQGTSFDTLVQGIFYENEIKSLSNNYVSYSFGPVIDKLYYNSISQFFTGLQMDSGNSEWNASISNNLAHPLSLIVLEGNYLKGYGRGTSFVLETFLDFSYAGVFLLSTILGFFLYKIWNLNYNKISYLCTLCSFIFIVNSLILPRMSFSHNFSFLFDIKFIVFVFALVLINLSKKLIR